MLEVVDTSEDDLKRRYAEALLRCEGKPYADYAAAIEIFGKAQIAKTLEVSKTWPNDPIVIEHRDEIIKERGGTAGLPDKTDIARKLWDMGKDETGKVADKERIAALRLLADIQGHIPKGSTTINNSNSNNSLTQNVMVVKDHGPDDAWEDKLKKQQSDLMQRNEQPKVIEHEEIE